MKLIPMKYKNSSLKQIQKFLIITNKIKETSRSITTNIRSTGRIETRDCINWVNSYAPEITITFPLLYFCNWNTHDLKDRKKQRKQRAYMGFYFNYVMSMVYDNIQWLIPLQWQSWQLYSHLNILQLYNSWHICNL